jgi:hypothetical protein
LRATALERPRAIVSTSGSSGTPIGRGSAGSEGGRRAPGPGARRRPPPVR